MPEEQGKKNKKKNPFYILGEEIQAVYKSKREEFIVCEKIINTMDEKVQP